MEQDSRPKTAKYSLGFDTWWIDLQRRRAWTAQDELTRRTTARRPMFGPRDTQVRAWNRHSGPFDDGPSDDVMSKASGSLFRHPHPAGHIVRRLLYYLTLLGIMVINFAVSIRAWQVRSNS
jgi:hypothetical protein